MSLQRILTALFDNGRPTVGTWPTDISSAEYQAAAEILTTTERCRALEFPGIPPPWNLLAGLWAAESFYHAGQLVVEREVNAEAATKILGQLCSPPSDASSHYSVDLVFHYLPDLHALARGVASADPLLAILDQWARDWPLSSVGMAKVDPVRIEPLVEGPLLYYYADRIILREDCGRLQDPRVREAVRSRLGAHQQLSPALWAATCTD